MTSCICFVQKNGKHFYLMDFNTVQTVVMGSVQ